MKKLLMILLMTPFLFANAFSADFDDKVYEEVSQKPEIVKSVAPKYPEQARKEKLSGQVFIEFIVEKDGSTSGVSVKKTSGHDVLDEAALTAVRQYRFSPGKIEDKPVRVKLIIPINFRLKE